MFNKLLQTLFAVGVVFFLNAHLSAAILYESGTLGPTGVSWPDLANGTIPGINIAKDVFNGVRFELTMPVVTSEIGGHFAAQSSGTFFGAIVQLAGENDFPDSSDLTTPDVLGSAVLSFPRSSAEVFGELSLSLDPGWYALVFGSGLFGAIGGGGAVGNNPDIGHPTYVGYQPGGDWFSLIDLAVIFRDYRFVVIGDVVPEPSTAILVLVPLALLLTSNSRKSLR
jgi:hypothetical protein